MMNYAVRLGELTSLQSAVVVLSCVLMYNTSFQQNLWNFREDIELFSLLDAFGKEQYFYNMTRNSLL